MHIVFQQQPDGTFKTFLNAEGSGIALDGFMLTMSEETHSYSTPTYDDYTKVIRQSETTGMIVTDPGDDYYVHTHSDGVNTTITPECR